MGSDFTLIDSVLVTILCICALYARLWTISFPECVVFDEVHFGNFSKWYALNKFHFDIHPPLAKMLMCYIAMSAQYQGEIESFAKIATPYEKNETSYISLRIIPAIFSSAVSPLLYCTLRNFAISPLSSLAAAIMIAFDSSMIVESKFILSDGILHMFCALHLFCFSLFLRTQDDWHALFAGITLGCAAACKFTALGLVALDGISQIFWILLKFPNIIKIIVRAILLLIPAVIVFFAVFFLHFAITPFSGKHSHYLDQQDRNTVFDHKKENVTYWGVRLINSTLLFRTLRWMRIMHRINFRSSIPHSFQSDPKYWPFTTDKQILFFSSHLGRRISCTSLPASYWPSTAGIILTPILFFFKFSDWRNLLMFFGWSVSYFPFLRVPRTMFNYHYLIPLIFACGNFGMLIENVFSRNMIYRGYFSVFFILLVIFCYLFFSPIVYGSMAKDKLNARKWLTEWYEGPQKPLYYYKKALYPTRVMRGKLAP